MVAHPLGERLRRAAEDALDLVAHRCWAVDGFGQQRGIGGAELSGEADGDKPLTNLLDRDFAVAQVAPQHLADDGQ